jgi:hypothetical protein
VTSRVDDLAREVRAAGFCLPEVGGRDLGSVLPAAAGALGIDIAGATAAQQRLGLPAAERVCVVLVDGLGHRMLTERAGHAPFMRQLLSSSEPLVSGFPSTTAASIGFFGTGLPAGRTGLAGYTVRNPATGGLANLVSWQGVEPIEQWCREPSLLSLISDEVPTASVGPGRFAASGLTLSALGGGEYVVAETLADRVDAAVRCLAEPGLVYLYWGEVDKVGHEWGWQSPQWADQVTETDRELGRLARSMAAGTLLVITADHGMVDVDRAQLIDVATEPDLAAGVELVAGEPRATHVHLVPELGSAEGTGLVAERWRSVLGDRAVVATRDEAIASGWFGEVAREVAPVIGDLVVAATGVAGVVDSRTQTPHSIELRGMHGSLTPGEMLVPLLVVV